MLRNILLCGLMVSVMTTIGCAKREGEPPRADTAKAGLMPIVADDVETTYLADQKQVALAGEVNVSLEPLESFRVAKAEEPSDSDEATDAPTSAAADDDEWAEEDDDGWGDEDDESEAESEEDSD